MIASPRPLTQLPVGSAKMAKVSELYDVTWEGNCGRGGRGTTKNSSGLSSALQLSLNGRAEVVAEVRLKLFPTACAHR